MSSNTRREEKRKQWEAEQLVADMERARRSRLTVRERIEEFVHDDELKTILHKIAEQCGLED